MSITLDPRTAGLAALRSAIDGQLHVPGDGGYDDARTPWNVAVDQRPAAVAMPTTARDVREIVLGARELGMRVAAQSTGHSPGALGDLADTILVRTSAMTDVHIDAAAGFAHVQAGALWEHVVAPAAAHGLVALHGSSPDVGVAGYVLGGGIGWLARRHGLAANALTAIEIVLPDGRLVRADHENHPDLFWALRGGGGNFGIATSFEMRLFPLEEVVAGWMIWPWEDSHRVLSAWATWTETAPDAVTSIARILQLPPIPEIPEPLRGRRLVVVDLAVLAHETDPDALLAPLRALAPEIDTVGPMPASGLVRLHQDPEGPTPGISHHAMLDALPAEAIDALVREGGPGSGSPLLAVELRQLGGALARPADGGGALDRLDGGFMLFAVGLPMDAEMGRAVEVHAERVVSVMEPWGRGRAYLNFAERRTPSPSAFGEDAHARLLRVRAQYDGTSLMQANHEIVG